MNEEQYVLDCEKKIKEELNKIDDIVYYFRNFLF